MKNANIILIILLLIILIPTGSKKNIVVAVEDFSTYIGYAAVTSSDVKEDVEPRPEVTPTPLCSCNGTGRIKSGDGIIDKQCPCGDGCTCSGRKPTSTGCQCGCGKPTCNCGKGAKGCQTVNPTAEKAKDVFFMYYFTATWCGPCGIFKENDIPVLIKNWKIVNGKWEKDSNIVIVNIDENNKLYHEILAKIPHKVKNKVKEFIPSFVVMKNGEPIDIHEGYLNYKDLANFYNKTVEANR